MRKKIAAPLRLALAGLLIPFVLLSAMVAAHAAISIKVKRHVPYNLFDPAENVTLTIQSKGLPDGVDSGDAELRDYGNKVVWSQKVALKNGELAVVDFGRLARGYYEFKIVVAEKSEGKASFGVMETVNRTAAQVRDGGFVFGVKWWGGVLHPREGVEALSKTGLQWTRLLMNQRGNLGIKEILTEFPMNAVVKIERFPAELFDAGRYGPVEEWEKKFGKRAWSLKTLPKKEPYQAWLRQQLQEFVPPEQNVFEVWNEPWDKMSPEDFATLSQWIVEVVRQERPKAVIGPNLAGNTSPFDYDARVIKAGGLKGMNMVALHPYGEGTDRAWMRGYKEWLKQQTGQDLDIYITEYGSHSTPAGPNRRSEREQALRVVQQSLCLYAEGVKSLIPHWLGQAETNPTFVEDWYGFVRMDENPKPALLAQANCARLIDGSRYVGDLWYGPKVGAMLFDNHGTEVLALWTDGPVIPGIEPPSKEVEIQTGVKEVSVVDIVGRERQEITAEGKVKLKLTRSPVYLVGVGAGLAKEASKELRADRWPQPEKPARVLRIAGKFAGAPALDGNLEEWKNAAKLGLLNPKVNGTDASGTGYVGWDDQFLYIGLEMRDNEMFNTKPRSKLYQGDSMELFLSAQPRETGSGFGPDDYQFVIAPASGEGQAVLGLVTDREAGVVTDVAGGRIVVGSLRNPDVGWTFEAAIPWTALPRFKPAAGGKLALDMRVNDADSAHERFKIDPSDLQAPLSVVNPSSWSLLELGK